MNRITIVGTALLAFAAVLPGCRSAGPRAQDGAVLGTLVGAGAGYAVGKHNGHRGTGTLIGAALGGLLGYAIGDGADDRRYGTRPYRDSGSLNEDVYRRPAPRREVYVEHVHVPVRRRVFVRRRPVYVEEEIWIDCE